MPRYLFSVTGSGDFPFSMLAISKAWPADYNEANKIALAAPTVAPEQTIILETAKHPEFLNRQLWANAKWPIQKVYT